MALKEASRLLDSSESDSETLPAFAFLKKGLSPTKRSQLPREEEIVLINASDSETSCLLSPPAPDTLETAAAQTKPAGLLRSGGEEEPLPLAERLKCKFLTPRQLYPGDSTSSFTSILDRQGSEGAPRDWKTQPFPKLPTAALPDTSEGTAPGDSPCHQFPCPGQGNSLTITRTHAEDPLPQKRAKHSQKARGRGWLGCRQRQGPVSQKESTLGPPEGKKKAGPVSRRPEESLKQLAAVLDPVLLQMEGGGQLLGALQSMECRCVIEAQAVPRSLTWRRAAGLSEDGKEEWAEEPTVLVLLLAEMVASLINNGKQGSLGGTDRGTETLQSVITDITRRTVGKALSLVIMDQENSFSAPNPPRRGKQSRRSRDQAKPKQQRGAEASPGPRPPVTRVDLEEALVELQLHTEAQVRVLQSWGALADFACAFTKAVAEAPFKKLRDQTGFSFCLESDWAGGVKVDSSGRGLAQVWRRQIQQLNRVSLEMASAIVNAFPSPRLLAQAYRRCLSEQERQNLLADIQVRRGVGVTSTSRRVGPELSRRIYLQMTSLQPSLSLDSAD
ncbi:crossover junction endonuclease EME1 isoform X1 [Echinops telfairi]|uniref:Crossover junction endonuclease EME1 isoform X1 n=1 Tax=Echinops telfairi TaxID=9371 RepID=A0ABM0IT50_ECHTE|nr:crossover junction endonuclease EME1 isoform X1 [Echinops telfairi]